MAGFQYRRPTDLDDAIAILKEHGPDARLLSGGTDLLVRLRLGHIRPAVVVDLKRVAALDTGIEQTGSSMRIGARTVMTDLIADARIQHHFPALVEAARVVGSVQIRNRATLAGNICNASPAADTAPALLVYGAIVHIAGPAGERRVALVDFFVGPGKTVLTRGELVVAMELPLPTEPAGAAFGRITRRKGVDLATINLVCLVTESGTARFAFGAVAPTPILVSDTTGALGARQPDAAIHDAALTTLIASAKPITDVRGSREYRMAMLQVMSERTWQRAAADLKAALETKEQLRQQGTEGGGALTTPAVAISMRVNGREETVEVAAHHTLLDVLRDQLHLTGSKECCACGECGACTVLLNGRSVCSCLVLAAEADGGAVTTIEGLEQHEQLEAIQTEFLAKGAAQCGFCIPGMIMSAKYLLMTNRTPTTAEIQEGLAGNLCRCGGYHRIIDAVKAAAGTASGEPHD